MTNHQPSFSEIVNIDELKALFEAFSTATGFPACLIDETSNEILIGACWRDICAKFHRANSDSAKHCITSDQELTTGLNTPGIIRINHCQNGLVDGSTPIIIEGRHYANLFTGQVLFESPDINRFKQQAQKYDYDEPAYLDALSKVPVISEEAFTSTLRFLSHIATAVAKIGLVNLQSQQAGNEIANQKALLDSLINSIPDLIFYKDKESVYLGCNKAFEEYAGKKEKDIIGRTDLDFFPKKVAEFYRNKDKKVITSGKAKHNNEWITYPDGSEVYLDTLKIPYIGPDGNIVGLIGVSRDTTQLKEAEQRLKIIFDTASDGILVVDADTKKFLTANKAICRMLGYTFDEMKKIGVMDIHPEKSLPYVFEQFEKQRKKEIIIAPDIPMKRKDGSVFYADISSSQMQLSDKQYLIGMIRDVTEKKRTENELLKIKKLESLGVLAGGIAHDFNNILTAILGNINLASMFIDPENKAYSLLEQAEKAIMRAKGLTQQLLTFSKGGEPVKHTSSIGKIINDSADFVLHGSSVICEYDIPEDLWMVDIDTGQISQVIQNIILNACHAMPVGGVIDVSCENISDTKTKPVFLSESKYVKITIADTGCGIPEKYIDKIFDPYFTTKQTGSGLGLATCHSIIGKHNGNISVQSEAGNGAAFIIYLPASLESIQSSDTPEEDFADAKCKCRILVMDDETIVLDVAKQMLEQLGHEVVLAKNGDETIKLYKKYFESDRAFDIIIMDLTIPGGMGGKNTIQEILRIDPKAKAIVSSGYSNDPVMAYYQEYGFKASIAKPFRMTELSKIISTVCI